MPLNAPKTFKTGTDADGNGYSFPELENLGIGPLSKLAECKPPVRRSILRKLDGKKVTDVDVKNLANWNAKSPGEYEIPFTVARVVLQDFTGVPILAGLPKGEQGSAGAGHITSLVNTDCRDTPTLSRPARQTGCVDPKRPQDRIGPPKVNGKFRDLLKADLKSRDYDTGNRLLGVNVVIYKSFERIYRSSLVGMGDSSATSRIKRSANGQMTAAICRASPTTSRRWPPSTSAITKRAAGSPHCFCV